MANTVSSFGLRPVRYLSGAPWNGSIQKCYVSANYATALFIGDPVLFSTTLADKDPTGRYPTVIASAGTAGTLIRGVIVGIEPDPDDLGKVYIPASTGGYVYIAWATDDLVFAIRGDGGGTPTSVFPGQNAVMIATTAGSTSTGLSGFNLDEGTTTAPTTTQNFTLHIIGIQEVEDNTLADDAVWEVLINTNENTTGRFLGITAA